MNNESLSDKHVVFGAYDDGSGKPVALAVFDCIATAGLFAEAVLKTHPGMFISISGPVPFFAIK